MFLMLAIPWVLTFLWCIFLLFHPPRGEPFGFGRAVAMGVGWQALWAAPLLLVQTLFGSLLWPHMTFSWSLERLVFLYWPWLIHVGGWTVTSVFDATAYRVTGHRHDTL